MLSNTVLLADQLRLQSALESITGRSGPTKDQIASCSGRTDNPAVGRLMIVKAYLGRTAMDSTSLSVDRCDAVHTYKDSTC